MINANATVESLIHCSLLNTIAKYSEESRLESNPSLKDLRQKLDNKLKNCHNPILKLYIQNFLALLRTLDVIAKKYGSANNVLKNPLIKLQLPQD